MRHACMKAAFGLSFFIGRSPANRDGAKRNRDARALRSSGTRCVFIDNSLKSDYYESEKIMPIIEMEDRVFQSWTKEETSRFLELTEKYKEMFEKEVLYFEQK